MRSDSPRPRRRIFFATVIVVVALGLGLIGFGIYGHVRGLSTTLTPPTWPDGGTSTMSPSSPDQKAGAHVLALPKVADPVAYARGIAEVIFTWDTMSGLTPQDYANALVGDADPSGYETPGLIADLTTYLPTDETWQQLRTYRTSQSLTIETAAVPASWRGIVAGSGDQLENGTVAVTITGSRRRAGSWDGQASHVYHTVFFTVFVVCAPAYDRCHLLRLSQLNNPLK